MTLEQLRPGHSFPEETVTITAEQARAYALAVGDETASSEDSAEPTVPPMTIVAAGLSRLIDRLGLAGGTVHSSQELVINRPVRPGEELTLKAVLRANSVRRGNRFLTVDVSFTDSARSEAVTSSSTIMAGGDS